MAAPPLLVTKITPPPLRGNWVVRQSLFAKLDQGASKKLILVAATAGFGKSTLIASWCKHHSNQACWLALDARDNDPVRFLDYLLATLQTTFPTVGQALRAVLQSPQPPSLEVALAIVVNQLAAVQTTAAKSSFVILDDLHLITNPDIHQALSFLISHLPERVTLILLSRSEPPLPIGRLRANNGLLELRTADLRLTRVEATTFLNETMGLKLSDALIAKLESRTEGWVAGLQLAALALQTKPNEAASLVNSFSGSHRFVLDYLVEEVLTQQPDEVRHFLLQTAVLQRLSADLCDAVLETADSQQMLAHLAQNNLFLLPLDQTGTWFRYHHLFGDLLQARLQGSDQTATALQKRAARWHEQNGLIPEAIEYALAAEDYEHATRLLNQHMTAISQQGQTTTLIAWHAHFPLAHLAAHPRLAVQFGLAFGLNGRWQEAEKLLALAEPHEERLPPSESLLLAYLVANNRHDLAQLKAIAAKAAALSHPDSFTQLVLGLIHSITGDQQAACRWATAAYEQSRRSGDVNTTTVTLFHLTRLLLFRGSLHEAHSLCQTALGTYNQPHLLALATVPHVSLGRIYLEWLDFDQAADHLQTTISLAERSGFVAGILSSATMLLAEVKQAMGQTEAVQELAERAIGYAKRYDPEAELAWLQLSQVQLWLRQGNVGTAVRWLAESRRQMWTPSIYYLPQFRMLVEARVLLAQQRVDEGLAILRELTAVSPSIYTPNSFALLALARQAQGNSHHAQLALRQALNLAQAENRRFPFLVLGQPMQKLLAQLLSSDPQIIKSDSQSQTQSGSASIQNHSQLLTAQTSAFAQDLLPRFPLPATTLPPLPQLTPRERDVLRLVAAGHTNQEIADSLTLANSTVKWYINTLYSKLQVQNRREAIAKTQQLGLFADS